MSTKLAPLLLVILVSSSSFFLHLSSAAFLCNKSDAIALLKIKKHFRDANGMASWSRSTDCCEWSEVACDPNGRVRFLTIFNSTASGPIPDSFAELSALELLLIQKHPRLTGPIPDIFAKFSKLISVQINYNDHLSGPIPPSLCTMPSPSLITLERNRLTGSIPDCFAANFTYLDFSHNLLTGSIPASIMKGVDSTSQQLYLDLSHNMLSGRIPRSLGNRNLTLIALTRNIFTGDASFLFGRKKSTSYIDISRNRLEFDLSHVKFPDSLTHLDMSRNRIWGRIPKQMAKIPNLRFLNVSYNELCGPIPKGFALQNIIKKSVFIHNKCLCDAPLPPCQRCALNKAC